MNPGNSDLYIVLGNFFFQMKKPAEAESAYLKAIDISPKEIKPYMVAAGFYDASGNADKTLAMYEKALALKPDDVNIMTSMAGYFLKRQQMDEAQQYLAKVLEERPNFFPARMMKGEIAAFNKEFSRGHRHLRSVG